jgi:hypothetical protein
MAQVAGIQIERDTKGQISYVRINVKNILSFFYNLKNLVFFLKMNLKKNGILELQAMSFLEH